MNARTPDLVRDDTGATALIVAVLMVVLLSLAAVVVDAGALYAERRKLQTAADAAALAGVQDLPASPGTAIATANTYANTNAPEASSIDAEVSSTNAANDTIRVTVTNPAYGLFFAKVMGYSSAPVGARATALVGSPSRRGNLMPYGVMAKEASGAVAPFGYTFGERIDLKVADGESGNYHMVELDEQAQHVVRAGGASQAFAVGDIIRSDPGERAAVAHAWDELIGDDLHSWGDVSLDDKGMAVTPTDGNDACPRVILVPIIVNPEFPASDPRHWNWWIDEKKGGIAGRKPVEIIGFAEFFVESATKDLVVGYFIEAVDANAIEIGSLNNFGIVSYTLLQ